MLIIHPNITIQNIYLYMRKIKLSKIAKIALFSKTFVDSKKSYFLDFAFG